MRALRVVLCCAGTRRAEKGLLIDGGRLSRDCKCPASVSKRMVGGHAGWKRLQNPAWQKTRSRLGFDGGCGMAVWAGSPSCQLESSLRAKSVCEQRDADAASAEERVVGIV